MYWNVVVVAVTFAGSLARGQVRKDGTPRRPARHGRRDVIPVRAADGGDPPGRDRHKADPSNRSRDGRSDPEHVGRPGRPPTVPTSRGRRPRSVMGSPRRVVCPPKTVP
ncbi:hypothetical protein GTS_46460 [Gandjariella thermophila]|uniref:Uncharacterized protein n=1 Tax=Gandjariella thermophila TaxID=1931992 RepID=A0A4D4JGJ3_9PSEU|nr:hypothetical protein GTS_46460 [Gandjariella thermophila]